MTDPLHDPFEDRLSEQLAGRAEQMPIRADGLRVIRHGVRRRRRNRVAAWTAGALVLVLAVVGGTVFGTRSGDSAPYVDTNTTTTADPNVPATIPAETLPALAPADGSGFTWQVASWSGPSAYMLVVRKDGITPGSLLFRVQSTPWVTTSTETTMGPDGQVITIDHSATNEVDLSWEISPGVTASVGTRTFEKAPGDPVEVGLELVASLATVEPGRWRGVIKTFFDPTGVLIADPSQIALGSAMDPVGRGTSGETTVNLWARDVGWGQLTLEERNGPSIPPEGEPITVRGRQGTLIDYVATSEGGRMRTVQWAESGFTYGLVFGAQITLEQAIAYANQLRPLSQDEIEQFLFPSWRPAEMPDMRLLTTETSSPTGS
jgi:hypothetical protein